MRGPLPPRGGLLRARRLAIAFCLLAAGLPWIPVSVVSAADGSLDLDSLLARFSNTRGMLAEVREEKHLSLLREPLVSHGTLAFVPPDRLVRIIRDPVQSRIVVNGEQFLYETPGDRGSVEIQSHPMLHALVDGMRHLLTGNAAGLRRSFEVEVERRGPESADSWRVDLRPRSEAIRERLAHIEIFGTGRLLERLRIRERTGDETRMVFSSVDLDHTFTDAEISALVGSQTQ